MAKLKKKHHYAISIIIIAHVILFLLFHHGIIHDGMILQSHDVNNAVFNLVKSHEGLIILTGLVFIGMVIGHAKWFDK